VKNSRWQLIYFYIARSIKMIIIGERINGMFKKVAKAISERDRVTIQEMALRQVEHGAHILDVNVGPSAAAPVEAMEWLVAGIQEVTGVPLSIDSAKAEVIEAGLKLCKNKALINSTTAEQAKLDTLLPLAKKYGASIIGLTMNEKGIPGDTAGRTELALLILAQAMEYEIEPHDIYIDPLILPVNVAQEQCAKVLDCIGECRLLSDPAPHLMLGLSNVSQKCAHRELINRTYLVMAMARGLDTAILDPFDRDLLDSIATAELLMGRDIYCDSFLDAWRKKKNSC
jgi:5-methyltetrahydrofolate corrinoid/iron sulfur protein methyltransferase